MATIIVDHAARSRQSADGRTEPASPSAKAGASRPLVAAPAISVNGITIARKAIAAEVQNFPARNPGEGWLAAARAMVVREVLLQEARRLRIEPVQRVDEDGREETSEDALIRTLVEQEVATPVATVDDLRRFYDRNRKRFVVGRRWEVDHILFGARRDDPKAFARSREMAQNVAGMLAACPDRFADLARRYSDCTSASLGGTLGQIGPGETTPEFERQLAGLEPGMISPPVETRYGIHLIRVTRRIEGHLLPFEAVREAIAAYLADHVQRRAHAQYVALLVGRAEICGIDLAGSASPLVQ